MRIRSIRPPNRARPLNVSLPALRARNGPPPAGLAVSAGLGAVLAYFLDPDRGRSRRAQTADRLAGLMRRGARRVGRGVRYVRATLAGLAERRGREDSNEREWPNDATLAHKVESEVFRDPTVPKGRMNINAEDGVVFLRGVAESRDQIERIIAATLAVDGVREVQSRLRAPGDPPAKPADEPGLAPAKAATASGGRH